MCNFRTIVYALAVFLFVSHGLDLTAKAEDISVSYTTFGSFNGQAPGSVATLGGLTFSGGSFTATAPTDAIIAQNAQFGDFSLNSGVDFDYSNSSFTLFVQFNNPGGVTPNPFSISSDITLGNIPVYFFSNGIVLSDVFLLNANNSAQLLMLVPETPLEGSGQWLGSIAASTKPVPEPATMLLLGTGLAGIGGMIKRWRHGK